MAIAHMLYLLRFILNYSKQEEGRKEEGVPEYIQQFRRDYQPYNPELYNGIIHERRIFNREMAHLHTNHLNAFNAENFSQAYNHSLTEKVPVYYCLTRIYL